MEGSNLASRRAFMASVAAGALLSSVKTAGAQVPRDDRAKPFKLKFAPHIGLLSPDDGLFRHLAGDDPADQVRFMADEGFTAMEDNFMAARPVDMQERIARAAAAGGVEMGVVVGTFVYNAPSFTLDTREERDRLVKEVRAIAECCRRVNTKWVTVLSGTERPGVPRDVQTANVIENLKFAGEEAAKHGLVLCLEAINRSGWPGTFVDTIPHADLIVRSVGMDSVRVLCDFYHQQMAGGDLVRTMQNAWERIAYVQIADNPGRFEPGTGEINYPNLMRRLRDKGFNGHVGCEFAASMPGAEGERAALKAIHAINPGN